jgi:hypothetical protein
MPTLLTGFTTLDYTLFLTTHIPNSPGSRAAATSHITITITISLNPSPPPAAASQPQREDQVASAVTFLRVMYGGMGSMGYGGGMGSMGYGGGMIPSTLSSYKDLHNPHYLL